ncbi:MAG: flavin reductase family protein [Kiritimatiellia bacterium]
MKKNLGVKSWLYPMPVLIIGSYDEEGRPNAMNAAWGGISLEDRISICVDDAHKTTANVLRRKAFTVHVADAANVVACDYVGIVSGNDNPEKFAASGFTAQKSAFVDAPVIAELPMVLECELLSYDKEDCRMVGKIANVAIDERCLDAEGKVDLSKLDPITFDPVNHAYLRLGEVVANAFQCGRQIAGKASR